MTLLTPRGITDSKLPWEGGIFKLFTDSTSKRPSIRGYFRILFLKEVFFLSFPVEVPWYSLYMSVP